MNNLLKTQLFKAGLIFIAILANQLHSCTLSAQGLKEFGKKYPVGPEASLSIKSFDISSNIAKIDGVNIIEEGGTIIGIAGRVVQYV